MHVAIVLPGMHDWLFGPTPHYRMVLPHARRGQYPRSTRRCRMSVTDTTLIDPHVERGVADRVRGERSESSLSTPLSTRM